MIFKLFHKPKSCFHSVQLMTYYVAGILPLLKFHRIYAAHHIIVSAVLGHDLRLVRSPGPSVVLRVHYQLL